MKTNNSDRQEEIKTILDKACREIIKTVEGLNRKINETEEDHFKQQKELFCQNAQLIRDKLQLNIFGCLMCMCPIILPTDYPNMIAVCHDCGSKCQVNDLIRYIPDPEFNKVKAKQVWMYETIKESLGINTVTCGSCGGVIFHTINTEEEFLICPHCNADLDFSDCPDLYI